jgi:hypothetical protein
MKVLKKIWLWFRLFICPLAVLSSLFFIFHGVYDGTFTSDLMEKRINYISLFFYFNTIIVCISGFKKALVEVKMK